MLRGRAAAWLLCKGARSSERGPPSAKSLEGRVGMDLPREQSRCGGGLAAEGGATEEWECSHSEHEGHAITGN